MLCTEHNKVYAVSFLDVSLCLNLIIWLGHTKLTLGLAFSAKSLIYYLSPFQKNQPI